MKIITRGEAMRIHQNIRHPVFSRLYRQIPLARQH